jgi:hypothetical protein
VSKLFLLFAEYLGFLLGTLLVGLLAVGAEAVSSFVLLAVFVV